MVMHNPLHPGLVVKDALIDNTGLTVTEAAVRIGVTRTTLSRLLNGRAGISPEMLCVYPNSLEIVLRSGLIYRRSMMSGKLSSIHMKLKSIDLMKQPCVKLN